MDGGLQVLRKSAGHATEWVSESGRTCVTALFDRPELAINEIRGADGLPMRRREGVEGQTGLQVLLRALDCRGIGQGMLGERGCNLLDSAKTAMPSKRAKRQRLLRISPCFPVITESMRDRHTISSLSILTITV